MLESCLKNKSVNTLELDARYNHSDYGDYCRRFAMKLSSLGEFRAITYLDADNYLEEHHLKSVLDTYHENYRLNSTELKNVFGFGLVT